MLYKNILLLSTIALGSNVCSIMGMEDGSKNPIITKNKEIIAENAKNAITKIVEKSHNKCHPSKRHFSVNVLGKTFATSWETPEYHKCMITEFFEHMDLAMNTAKAAHEQLGALLQRPPTEEGARHGENLYVEKETNAQIAINLGKRIQEMNDRRGARL